MHFLGLTFFPLIKSLVFKMVKYCEGTLIGTFNAKVIPISYLYKNEFVG